LYSTAHFVGIADGARSNWDFLGPHIDEQILDFYHATQYLARAAAAFCKGDEEREQWLDEQCHNLKHKHHAAQRRSASHTSAIISTRCATHGIVTIQNSSAGGVIKSKT
jgi:hypothetical protein